MSTVAPFQPHVCAPRVCVGFYRIAMPSFFSTNPTLAVTREAPPVYEGTPYAALMDMADFSCGWMKDALVDEELKGGVVEDLHLCDECAKHAEVRARLPAAPPPRMHVPLGTVRTTEHAFVRGRGR